VPKLSLLPREGKFFILFEDSANNAADVAKKLRDLLYNWNDVAKGVEEIIEMEHKGDAIAHEIISLVHKTFVTPLDREDIALLAHSLDDIVDFMESAADAMNLYKITQPTARSKELADIIVETTQELQKAVSDLRKRIDLKQILKRCVEINRLENMADKVYRAALAELFEETGNITSILKWREIYEYMETASDRCEDVANVLEGVAIKYS
jgi:uncharacterized protein